MSYTLDTAITHDWTTDLPQVLAQARIAPDVADAVSPDLETCGQYVTLDTGDVVWCACVLHDLPSTPKIDFLTVAVACDSSGAPTVKPNGQYVQVVYWHGEWPDRIASLTLGTIRKALLMIALGEPQPQVPIPDPATGGPTTQDAIPGGDAADRNIRLQIEAAQATAAPLTGAL